jgi:hypothetical protein
MMEPSSPLVACTSRTTLIHPYKRLRCGYLYQVLSSSLCTLMVAFPWLVPATMLFWSFGGDIAAEESWRNRVSSKRKSPLTNSVDHIVIRMFIVSPKSGTSKGFSLSDSVQINDYHQCTLRKIQVTLPHVVLLRKLE